MRGSDRLKSVAETLAVRYDLGDSQGGVLLQYNCRRIPIKWEYFFHVICQRFVGFL